MSEVATTNNGIAVKQSEPVAIQQLYKNPEILVDRDKLVVFLNQDPPSEWVKVHPFIKNYKYLPIEKTEFMLKRFFKVYTIDVKEYKQILNAITCCVRVSYLDPLTNEMTHHEGVGGCEMQTEKGTGPLKLDASNINPGAVTMALGIAKSVAVKDACDHIGNIFGANLNRKDTLPIQPDMTLMGIANTKEHERMIKLIDAAKNRETLDGLREHLTEALTPIFEARWMQLK